MSSFIGGLKYIRVASVLALSALAWAGCTTTTSTTPTSTPTQMQWKSGETANYQRSVLDSNSGQPTGTAVTFNTTLVTTNQNQFGMTNVNGEYRSGYSDGTSPDTVYYSQNASGDLYEKGFGLGQTVNSLGAYLAVAGIQAPLPTWMLEAKMSGSAGTNWVPFLWDTSKVVTLPGFPLPVTVTFTITDNATMAADTTFSVSGKSYVSKHAQHTLSISASAPLIGNLLSWNEVIDAFISPDLATPTLTQTHPSALTVNALLSGVVPISNTKYNGSQTLLISHN